MPPSGGTRRSARRARSADGSPEPGSPPSPRSRLAAGQPADEHHRPASGRRVPEERDHDVPGPDGGRRADPSRARAAGCRAVVASISTGSRQRERIEFLASGSTGSPYRGGNREPVNSGSGNRWEPMGTDRGKHQMGFSSKRPGRMSLLVGSDIRSLSGTNRHSDVRTCSRRSSQLGVAASSGRLR